MRRPPMCSDLLSRRLQTCGRSSVERPSHPDLGRDRRDQRWPSSQGPLGGRTSHASAFVVGGVLATAILTTGFAGALALGVRVELPGTASAPVVVRDAGAPAPIQPSVVGRRPYDGPLDPIERTYIFRSKAGHRLAPRPPTKRSLSTSEPTAWSRAAARRRGDSGRTRAVPRCAQDGPPGPGESVARGAAAAPRRGALSRWSEVSRMSAGHAIFGGPMEPSTAPRQRGGTRLAADACHPRLARPHAIICASRPHSRRSPAR